MKTAISPRLLVAQTGFLGDVVLTTPLLATLHRHLAPSSLTVMTTPQAKPLLDYHPVVTQVLVDAKHTEGQGVLGLWRMAQQLRRQRFTLAVAPHKSFRTALLLMLAGIPRRIGFRQSPGWFLYHHTAIRDPYRHEVERILCIMRAFGLEPEDCDRKPLVAYGHEAQSKAEALLHEVELDGTEPLFVVCPGSVWATKRWTADGFAELVQKLHRNYGRVLLCGGPDDTPIARMVHERSGQCGINLVGRADLQTFMALVDRAQLVISNDSAPMHVAVARHVPVVAIFCATTPSLGYGPYSDCAVIVEKKDLFCRPCRRHGGPTCPRGTDDCMRQVTVAEVLAGVDTLIANTGTKRMPISLPVHV